MANPNHDESLATKILSGIEVLLSSFAAQKDAHDFALDIHANTDELAAHIEQVKLSPESIALRPSHFPLENLQLEVYLPAYLASLSNLLITISQRYDIPNQPPNKLNSDLYHKSVELYGACKACMFALEQHGTLDALKKELDWSKKYIVESFAENPKGRMSPSAMPRWERDGYNMGLRECIERIEAILAEHDL